MDPRNVGCRRRNVVYGRNSRRPIFGQFAPATTESEREKSTLMTLLLKSGIAFRRAHFTRYRTMAKHF